VLLHIAGHGLAKSAAFCSAGHIAQLAHTTRIGRVRGLLARAPALGAGFGLAVLALLGLPPFSLFASELGIARAGFVAGGAMGWAVTAALVLLLVAFAALALRTARMVLGPAPGGPGAMPVPVRMGAAAGLPWVVGLLACAALGLSTGPLTALLSDAAAIIAGGH
jgi:hydrogenase-4 component F